MPRATSPLTLSVDTALLTAYRRALAPPSVLPLPAVALDAALRAQLAAAGHPVPAPLLAPASPGSDRRRQKKDAAPVE